MAENVYLLLRGESRVQKSVDINKPSACSEKRHLSKTDVNHRIDWSIVERLVINNWSIYQYLLSSIASISFISWIITNWGPTDHHTDICIYRALMELKNDFIICYEKHFRWQFFEAAYNMLICCVDGTAKQFVLNCCNFNGSLMI